MNTIGNICLASAMILLSQQVQGASAPTVKSAASGWIDLDRGTQFFSAPEALCPNGTLHYEGDASVTCSNNSRIFGIWAYACPVGYLPDAYPSAWWETSLVGNYGVNDQGVIPLGEGDGNFAKACYLNSPTPSLLLTLTGASQLKPAGTTDSVNLPLIAKVMTREGAPVSGVQVSFEANVVAYSGGHEHHDNSRPLTNLTPLAGSTNGNGEIAITVRAPEVAGVHTIIATCGACENRIASKEILIKVPDLLAISPSPPKNGDGSYAYALTSVDRTHAGNGRYHKNQYYLTEFSRKNVRALIDAFVAEGWGTVALNDASLPWGGRYDINANWRGPHEGHREGREIDISFTRARNPISAVKQKTFYKKFCEEKSVQVPFSILHHYALNPHFHVYLEKQTSCWMTEK
jgi:hypothetical protein